MAGVNTLIHGWWSHENRGDYFLFTKWINIRVPGYFSNGGLTDKQAECQFQLDWRYSSTSTRSRQSWHVKTSCERFKD